MSNQPEAIIRDGVLKITIWKNQRGEDGKIFYSANLTKSYRDGEEWKETDSYNSEDLLKISNLMQQAYNKITQLKQEQ